MCSLVVFVMVLALCMSWLHAGPAIASSCFYLAEALAARGDLKPAMQCALKGCAIRQVGAQMGARSPPDPTCPAYML